IRNATARKIVENISQDWNWIRSRWLTRKIMEGVSLLGRWIRSRWLTKKIVKGVSSARGWIRSDRSGSKPVPPENQSLVPTAGAEAAKPSVTDDSNRSVPLLPSDERGFAKLVFGLLLALGAVPIWGIWVDSRATEIAADRSFEIAHLEKAWKDN